MTQTQSTVIKSFGAEQAGERVGWAAINEDQTQTGDDIIILDIAVATVGPDGALVREYNVPAEVSPRSNIMPESHGFVGGVALSAVIVPEVGIEFPHHQILLRTSGTKLGGHKVRASDLMVPGHSLVLPQNTPEVTWTDQPATLIDVVKTGLTEHGFEHEYPKIYYALNQASAHESLRPNDITTVNGCEWLVADPDMIQETKIEQSVAEDIVLHLDRIDALDSKMLKRLTVFSDIPARRVASSFVASRQRVAQHERRILDSAGRLNADTGVYLPPSHGRTWPYLDPAAGDDRKAFGHELRALKLKNIQPVVGELNREKKSLSGRQEWARQGHYVLQLLSRAEHGAADARS